MKINEIPDVTCPVCGCVYFQPCVRVKWISKLHPSNRQGKDVPVLHQVLVCMGSDMRVDDETGEKFGVACGHIVDLSDQETFITRLPAPDVIADYPDPEPNETPDPTPAERGETNRVLPRP